jgi:hypothetical protein
LPELIVKMVLVDLGTQGGIDPGGVFELLSKVDRVQDGLVFFCRRRGSPESAARGSQ